MISSFRFLLLFSNLNGELVPAPNESTSNGRGTPSGLTLLRSGHKAGCEILTFIAGHNWGNCHPGFSMFFDVLHLLQRHSRLVMRRAPDVLMLQSRCYDILREASAKAVWDHDVMRLASGCSRLTSKYLRHYFLPACTSFPWCYSSGELPVLQTCFFRLPDDGQCWPCRAASSDSERWINAAYLRLSSKCPFPRGKLCFCLIYKTKMATQIVSDSGERASSGLTYPKVVFLPW